MLQNIEQNNLLSIFVCDTSTVTETHNSIKAGITRKLCFLMESYCLGTAQGRSLICAAGKALQITTPSVLPPGSCAQQNSPGALQEPRAAPPAPGRLGQEGQEGQEPQQAPPEPPCPASPARGAAPPAHQTAGNKEQALQRVAKAVNNSMAKQKPD